MDRRALLQTGAAALAAAGLSRSASAQTAGMPAFYLDAYSKNLQWCRTPAELAKAVIDLGLKSIDLNVAAYPGHVDPARVRADLPAMVTALRSGGVMVRSVTTPITSAQSPYAEDILAAAAAAGVGYYTWSGAPIEDGRTFQQQQDSLKARFAALAALNEKYKIKGLYQPKAGMAGSLFVDLMPVLVGFDPRYTGVRYDTAALLQTRSDNVVRQLKLGGPYIGGVAINDAAVNLEFPEWEQGRFTGNPEILLRPNGGGDNLGNAGGDWLAYGGGGRPLPYRYRPMPVGTGMIDLMLLGKTLKEINFNGPAECQVEYALGGAETGADKIAYPRQEVIGRIKRDRIAVEQAFHIPWGLKVALPPFMLRQEQGGDAAPAAGGRPPAAEQ